MALVGSTAITYRAPSGVAGDVTKPEFKRIEDGFFNASYLPTAWGVPVIYNSEGKFRKFTGAATAVKGFLTRQAPQLGGDPDSSGASTAPSALIPQGIMTAGFLNVLCTVGTPVRYGVVYVRVTADTGKAVGDLEATADATATASTITGTGTGTMAASVDNTLNPLKTGTYTVTLLSTSQTAQCKVVDPDGYALPPAIVGSPYQYGGLIFTITAAGTMTSGDYFTIAVVRKNEPIANVFWAVDGKDANNNAEIRIG